MEFIIEVALIIILSVLLSLGAYVLKFLTLGGSIASFATGAVVGVFGGFTWFVLLMLFTIAGFAATRFSFLKKKEAGLQEGVSGERNHMNILGVGLPPCIFAVFAYVMGGEWDYFIMTIGFVASISVAAADTVASEIGVKDKNVWLCTNFKRVPPGTNGGVSVLGTLVGLAAALVTSILGWLVLYQTLDLYLLIPAFAGIIGCFLDSFLGATIETWGYISKYTNNAATGVMGAVIAMFIAYCLI